MRAVIALQDGEVSRPTLIGNQYVVEKLLERKASHIPPFEEVKDAVRDALVRERSHTHWHGRRLTNGSLNCRRDNQSSNWPRHLTRKQSRPAYFPEMEPSKIWPPAGVHPRGFPHARG